MKQVLVVEDDPTLRSIVAQVLRDEGYEVDTAADGAEALAKVREGPPDAVVCDLVLPGLDGPSFVEACRSDPVGRAIPIVLVSSVDAAATVARRLPVQGYLAKPFELEHLVATVGALAGATTKGG
jgi:CheY-like chemotaxis protein